MDFEDGEYDVLKHRRAHRAASVAFALAIAVAGFVQSDGSAFKLLVLPVLAIWFADELADSGSSPGGWLTAHQTALGFRWLGWLGLVILAVFTVIR